MHSTWDHSGGFSIHGVDALISSSHDGGDYRTLSDTIGKSTALPVELVLRVPDIFSQYHDLTNRLARYLLGLVNTIVRENSWFVRVSLQSAMVLTNPRR